MCVRGKNENGKVLSGVENVDEEEDRKVKLLGGKRVRRNRSG